jgi:hypothetical protein
MAIVIGWLVTQICVRLLLSSFVVLGGALILIAVVGISVLEMLGVPIQYLLNYN